ncbi:MAG: TIGR01440 family protein [Clostridia bacterium]|nr:TIGR01440 family protein [Clostridia bacterium]
MNEAIELKNEIFRTIDAAVDALCKAGDIQPGGVIVLGCSTSEVAGARIGKGSVPELGEVIAEAMLAACAGHGVNAAFQCCEHLNRAIVLEQRVLREMGLTQVRAIPQPKAGGSVPAAAWKRLTQPALAISIQADAAIDVGDTLVGMHIRPVAVPLRIDTDKVGHANLVMAYSRLPYIGGSRAVYE